MIQLESVDIRDLALSYCEVVQEFGRILRWVTDFSHVAHRGRYSPSWGDLIALLATYGESLLVRIEAERLGQSCSRPELDADLDILLADWRSVSNSFGSPDHGRLSE